MNLIVSGKVTQHGLEIGKEDFLVDDAYDMGFLHDGTSHVIRVSRMYNKDRSEFKYFSLEDYAITIRIGRGGET